MILPTKHLPEYRTLLHVGAAVLSLLTTPKTVSRVWEEIRGSGQESRVSFDWFVLALDLLYILGVLSYEEGRLRRKVQ